MEFRDLKKQYQVLKPEMDAAMQDVLTTSHYISGPQVKALEQQLADYVGVKHCITCANGTIVSSLAKRAQVALFPAKWNFSKSPSLSSRK